ncbi:MAG TPA: hypothetical protein VJK05_01045 [archaeon]|nr:hypothetical protein [archaeon]
MGLLDKFIGRKTDPEGIKEMKAEAAGKYEEQCPVCGQGKTEVKWMGKYWHKKCKRKAKKMAKGMM